VTAILKTPTEPGGPDGSPVLRGLLLAALLGIAGFILLPYVVPLLWAGILAFSTFPLLTYLRKFVRRPVLSSLLMTVLFLGFIIIPILSFALPLTQEVLSEVARLRAFLANPQATLPVWIDHIPFLGKKLEYSYGDFRSHTPTLSILLDKLQTHLLTWGDKLFSLMTDAGKILVKTLILLLGLFSFYLKGPELWRGIRIILVRWGGSQVEEPLRQIGPVTRGVVYGMFFTALAQTVLAGIGFGVAHVPEALLLTFLLFFLALFPMGAVAVWLPASFTLLAQGRTLAFILFLVWNALIVGGIENVIKPIFIGRSSEMPFILILLGVLGGLEAFGVIGLFIGPVILAILQKLWQENMPSRRSHTSETPD
jgi:predicted PurR-regulated permease PerM